MRLLHRYTTAALVLGLAACSPSQPPPQQQPPEPRAGTSAPGSAVLGSPAWYAWVDRTLGIGEEGHGPDQGSDEWNRAVQARLGEEAPQLTPGTPQWQQAVDALLRTRGGGPS